MCTTGSIRKSLLFLGPRHLVYAPDKNETSSPSMHACSGMIPRPTSGQTIGAAVGVLALLPLWSPPLFFPARTPGGLRQVDERTCPPHNTTHRPLGYELRSLSANPTFFHSYLTAARNKATFPWTNHRSLTEKKKKEKRETGAFFDFFCM